MRCLVDLEDRYLIIILRLWRSCRRSECKVWGGVLKSRTCFATSSCIMVNTQTWKIIVRRVLSFRKKYRVWKTLIQCSASRNPHLCISRKIEIFIDGYSQFSSYWDEIFLIVNEKPEVIVVWLLVSGKNISSLACTAHHVMHNNSVTLLTASHGHEDENGTISCKTVRYLPFLQPSSSTSGVLFQA